VAQGIDYDVPGTHSLLAPLLAVPLGVLSGLAAKVGLWKRSEDKERRQEGAKTRSEDRHCVGRFQRSRRKVWLEIGRIDSRRVSWFVAAE
jgi:hypothetical protein